VSALCVFQERDQPGWGLVPNGEVDRGQRCVQGSGTWCAHGCALAFDEHSDHEPAYQHHHERDQQRDR
jgi:hypothetical protein